ncbi:CHC2 zinc finger domain-containing protein [Brevibacillus sp. 179-C9.3 HS]|uniref:CHC2 zinc finger domain-containing protein n=1 Tax=unclassified Brevibacillus TaxID=2684853 RepID=UPI0039A0608E
MKFAPSFIDTIRSVSVLELAERMNHAPQRRGSSYVVFCPNPLHEEKTPDCYIEPRRNFFNCFGGGGCGAKGDAIKYWSWAVFGSYDPKQHYIEALVGIAKVMNIPVEYEGSTSTVATQKSQSVYSTQGANPSYVKSPRNEVEARSAVDCDRIYRKFLSLCSLLPEHAMELIGPKRQYTNEQVVSLLIRSVPAREDVQSIIRKLLDSGESLDRVPGFTKRLRKNGDPSIEKDWYWTINASKGYFIPVRDENARIVRLRVATGGTPKYIWFSSPPNVSLIDNQWVFDNSIMERDREKNLIHMSRGGAPSGAPINVVAPQKLMNIWDPGTHISSIMMVNEVLVTEGEHKSTISANKLKRLVLGLPGVGNWKDVVPLVQAWGVQRLVLAYDSDALYSETKVAGKNVEVFKALVEFAKSLLAIGLDVVLWTWNSNDGKGLDDLLLSNKLPTEIDLRTREKRPVQFA